MLKYGEVEGEGSRVSNAAYSLNGVKRARVLLKNGLREAPEHDSGKNEKLNQVDQGSRMEQIPSSCA